MAKKFFTDESLATFVNETKTYTNNAVAELSSVVVYASDSNENISTETDGILASEVSYVNTTSGLSSTNVQTAIDELTEETNQLFSGKVDKTNITLEQYTDGLVYIFVDGRPVGNGVELGTIVEGDVVGTLDESNNILLSGNLASGIYTLKYENVDGTYTEIGKLEVGAETEVTIIGIVAKKTKTTYTTGDTLDTSDITLTINYSDGTSGNITSGFIVDTSMVQMNTVGNYNIAVSYEGFSSNVVIVVEKAPEVYSGYDVYELFGYTDSSRLGSSSIYNGTASGYVLTGAIPLTELVGKTITIRTKGLSYVGGGGVWGIMSDNSMSASYVKRGVCSDSTIWQDIQLSYNEPDANGIASFTMLIPETYATGYLRISAKGDGATSQVTIDREITA